MKRRLLSRGTLLVVTGTLALTACSGTNPATIAHPYAAGDGTNGEITDQATGIVLKLRNFLLVGTAKGKPAVLVGAIANEGDQAVAVQLIVTQATADGSAPPQLGSGKVTAKPNTLTQIGPGGTVIEVPELTTAPGSVIQLRAVVGPDGQTISLPVVAGSTPGPYASITAGPVPSPSAS